MSKTAEIQMKIAELLQANEAAMTLVEQLTAERDALAATVEALREAIDGSGAYKTNQLLSDALHATPQQHLREVRADAGRAGWVACVDWLVENSSADLFTDGEAEQAREIGDQYAECVRAGEK